MAEAYSWFGTKRSEKFVFSDDQDRFDFVQAAGGNDLIADGLNDGLWSSDFYAGQRGNDTLVSLDGHDTLHGGKGTDLLFVQSNWYDANDVAGVPSSSPPDIRGFDITVRGGRAHDVFTLVDSAGYSIAQDGDFTVITTQYGGTITVRGVEEFHFL